MIVVFDLSCYLTKMKLNRNTAGGAESGKATPNSLFMKLYKTTECMGRGDALGPGPRRCPPPPLLFAGVRRRETPFPAMVGVLDKVPAGSEMTPFAFSLLFYFLPLFLWPLGIPHLQGEEDFLLTVHLGGHTGMLTHRKENCIFFFSHQFSVLNPVGGSSSKERETEEGFLVMSEADMFQPTLPSISDALMVKLRNKRGFWPLVGVWPI